MIIDVVNTNWVAATIAVVAALALSQRVFIAARYRSSVKSSFDSFIMGLFIFALGLFYTLSFYQSLSIEQFKALSRLNIIWFLFVELWTGYRELLRKRRVVVIKPKRKEATK